MVLLHDNHCIEPVRIQATISNHRKDEIKSHSANEKVLPIKKLGIDVQISYKPKYALYRSHYAAQINFLLLLMKLTNSFSEQKFPCHKYKKFIDKFTPICGYIIFIK